MTDRTEALREEIARAWCASGGFDPDEMMPNDGPRWKYYLEGADAILPIITLEAEIARKDEALRKVMPIRVEDGPDYASVYFGDGSTHSTKAMTMNPQDWLDISAALGETK